MIEVKLNRRVDHGDLARIFTLASKAIMPELLLLASEVRHAFQVLLRYLVQITLKQGRIDGHIYLDISLVLDGRRRL